MAAAYLNAPIPDNERVYMRQLEGFDDGTGRVYRLFKCLYGLRKSGRYWAELLSKRLINEGRTRCRADPCVFVYRAPRIFAILGVYVDDMHMPLAGNDDPWIDEFEACLSARFKVKCQQNDKPYGLSIGMSIDYDRPNHRVTLTQTTYIAEILDRFGMSDCKSADVPMVADFYKHSTATVSASPLLDDAERSRFVEFLGCLLYVSTCTRPDITTALSVLGGVQKQPRTMHMP
eukprot:jgi/Tetstr1/455264/TSEL_042102.t1